MHRNLKTTNYYYRRLWFSFLMPNWLFTSYTVTFLMSISVLPGLRVSHLPVTCDLRLFFAHGKREKRMHDHRLFHRRMSTYKLPVKFVH